MRTMRSIELPLTPLIYEIYLNLLVVTTLLVDLKLLAGSHEVSPTVRPQLLHRASDGKESPESINEAGCVHRLNNFNVDRLCAHASEDNCPSLGVGLTTPGS